MTLLSRCRRCLVADIRSLLGNAYADLLGDTVHSSDVLRGILKKGPFAVREAALEAPHLAQREVAGQLVGERVCHQEQGLALVGDPKVGVGGVTVVAILDETANCRGIGTCRRCANPKYNIGPAVDG